ncbi:sugar ABC transporter permease [Paenibacillus psychroresistens]|uniref:Sugar ABC transporter permease n=1 Tax=Paenibacillus psychroresistens TaxID=1778678 RepID=A0A6B8RCX3_9BACL|nr:sugar ABC transporter permease [Paenibacillus psychroresistens]QGQ94020.1 sugar ABC transporter permease [Paenibacillus psychroresistens]
MSSQHYRNKAASRESMAAYILIAPAIILFLVIGLFTVGFSLWLSFYHLPQGSLISNAKFAGLDNFKDFLLGRDQIISEKFWLALKNNMILCISMVFLVIPISLLISILLQSITKGVRFFRTLFLLPMVTSSVAIYYVWTGIYDPEGSINQFLKAVGLIDAMAVNGWLGELNTALPAIIVVIVLGGVPGTMILYFAGLQTVDPHLYESADIDGANFWQKLVNVTWPILRPITIIAIIINLNGALQIFDQVWVMTKGGPAGTTEVVSVLMFKEAFVNRNGDLGTANAMGWIMFLFTFVLSLISIKSFKDKT